MSIYFIFNYQLKVGINRKVKNTHPMRVGQKSEIRNWPQKWGKKIGIFSQRAPFFCFSHSRCGGMCSNAFLPEDHPFIFHTFFSCGKMLLNLTPAHCRALACWVTAEAAQEFAEAVIRLYEDEAAWQSARQQQIRWNRESATRWAPEYNTHPHRPTHRRDQPTLHPCCVIQQCPLQSNYPVISNCSQPYHIQP